MKYFEVHLVEHCNLKCQSCDNFSAIAEEEFVSEDVFVRDMKRMSELFSIDWLRLLGGEPLLHPNINFFLEKAREFFPLSEIRLTTNGILLKDMPEEFWQCCGENDIIIEITHYPINIHENEFVPMGEKYGVNMIYFDNEPPVEKYSHRNPVNDKGNQDIEFNFKHCYQVHRCMSLKDGKIYPCTCIPNIYHFNKFFNKNIPVSEQDYIEITHTAEEIDEFLNKPVPFCAYCNVKNRTGGKLWAVSKKVLEEWFDEE